MGRYDKIQVYHENAWHVPKRIRVYKNGAWNDLGADDSDSTKTMYVRNASEFVRCTLNKTTRTVVSDRYIAGAFHLYGGYCRNKDTSNWYFKGTIEKTENNTQNIFYCGDGNPSSPGNRYISVSWLDNGKIRVTVRYYSGTYSMDSDAVIAKNIVIYLEVYANKGSNNVTIYIKQGANEWSKTASLPSHFEIRNPYNIVGDTYMRFRNTLSAAGCYYANGFSSVSFDANTASGNDYSNYYDVTHHEDATVVIDYV